HLANIHVDLTRSHLEAEEFRVDLTKIDLEVEDSRAYREDSRADGEDSRFERTKSGADGEGFRGDGKESRGDVKRAGPTAEVRVPLPSDPMGKRNHAETMMAIVDAFHAQNTWTQAGLAERIGIEPRAVRLALDKLVNTKRFPLERSTEGKHVYWSLPK